MGISRGLSLKIVPRVGAFVKHEKSILFTCSASYSVWCFFMLSLVYSRSLATLVVLDKSVQNIFRVNFPTNPDLVMWGFAGDLYRSIVPRGGAFNDSTLQIPTSARPGVGGA